MDETCYFCGIDPVDFIVNKGLLQAILNLSDDAILVFERANNSSGDLIGLPILFANKAAQALFNNQSALQDDLLNFDISFPSGNSLQNHLDQLSISGGPEEEVLYAKHGEKEKLRLLALKVSDRKLIFFFKNTTKPKPKDLGLQNQELFQEQIEQALTRALKEQQHFIEQVFQASPVLINIFDLTTGVFTYFSKEVASFVGYTSESVLSMSADELLGLKDEADKQRVMDFYYGFGKSDDEVKTIEYRIMALDGTARWLRARGKVFRRDENGQATQIICATQDFTETKEAEDRLKENELMQLLLQRKDEFINVASHELKSPLTTVKASLQILQRMVDRQEKPELMAVFLKKALFQVNKLTNLTKDLIDNAKLQTGKLHLNLETFDLDSFIEEAIEEQTEGFKMIVHNAVKRPVKADRRRLEQVLKNFLSNAAKYSPFASTIVIEAEEEDDSFKISVRDFGIGIPEKDLASVFDRFYRVDDNAIQFSGLGLGLHICAEIIKLHGGEYGVHSVKGEGSTFWFSIPDEESRKLNQML